MDFLKQAVSGAGGEANLMKEAQGFMGSQQSSSGQQTTNAPASGTQQQATPGKAPPPADLAGAATAPGAAGNENYSQVYGSAETLYQGLSDKFSGKKDNIDDQQLAGAASNVLEAAENTGFVKDSQYGQYFDKAESYLQNYSGSQSGAPASGTPAGAAPHATGAAPASAPKPAQ